MQPAQRADQAHAPFPATRFATVFESVVANVEQALRGKRAEVRKALVCLFAGGHLLIEDVPGLGKTTLAKALATSMDARWRRIQFTPDLLPTDITGVSVWNQPRQSFEFHPGAVFANLVVGDEINRASPKTQSALLEVMEERQVTVDGAGYQVPLPFMVIATQNPVDLGGTYRLPEAQLDRFLLRLRLGYPDARSESALLLEDTGRGRRAASQVTDLAEVERMIECARGVRVSPAVCDYVVAIVEATRRQPEIRLGASPRASQALLRAAKASAAADARGFVVPDDVKSLAADVLTHRLVLTPDAEVSGRRAEDVLADLVGALRVPTAGG